jgi:nitric oxide reductase subunit B
VESVWCCSRSADLISSVGTAVGFWNFLGAGVFGFLINMPIVSYFEVGTVLTPNHAHASFMGVFGLLGVALLVFTCREIVDEGTWVGLERWVRVSFWGLNLGLASMITFNLFPGGVMQLYDVLQNGYWHARGHEYLSTRRPASSNGRASRVTSCSF